MNQDQTRTEEAQIRELVESWADAVRHKDMKAILAHHAPDLLMFDVPPPLQLKGIEAYEASWSGFFFWLERGGTFHLSDLVNGANVQRFLSRNVGIWRET